MILTHGSNSISRGGVGDEFIFYTDFSQVDTSTQIDTPIIGGIGEYNNGNFYINQMYASGGPFNGNYVLINHNVNFKEMINPYRLSKIVDEYSFECWMKRVSSSGLYIEPPYSGSIFILNNLIHLDIKGELTCTLYNGTTYHTNTSSRKIIKTTDDTYPWVHIATVVSTGEIKLYTNGLLRAKFIRQNLISLSDDLWLYGTGSSGSTNVGYISVRKGDKSTNDHQNFPVPTAPYL